MALEHTQVALSAEIEASKAQLQPHLETLDAEQLATCGIGYGDVADNAEIPNDPENHSQSYLSEFLSVTAMGLPQCVINAHGEDWPEDRALLLEMACNEIATQGGMREFVRRTATDFCYRAANAVCSLKPVRDYDGSDKPAALPTTHRLAFDEYLEDSTAVGAERKRWKGHRVARDVDDVIADARKHKGLGWDLSALESIKDTLPRDERSVTKRQSSVERRQLVYWVMWEPGFQIAKDERVNGTLHYVLDKTMPQDRSQADAMIRKSEGWYGSRIGPYAHAGATIIGDLHIELSPLVASASQAKYVNDIARAIRDGVNRYKSNTVVRGDDMYGLLHAALNGDMIRAPEGQSDVRTMLAQVQSGGAPQEMLVAFEMAKQSLQRGSGIYDTRQGDTSQDTTATAILDAQAGFKSRMDMAADPYWDFLRQIFTNWAYWADCSPNVRRRIGPIPPEMQQQLGVSQEFIETKGGFDKGSKRSPRDHDMLALAIDPFSTRSRSEQTMAQDLQVVMGVLQFIAALGPMAAAIDVDLLMRWVARSRGMKDATRVLDSGILRAIIGMTLGGQETPPAKGTGGLGQSLSFNGPRRVPSAMNAPQRPPSAPLGPRAMPGPAKAPTVGGTPKPKPQGAVA